VVDMDISYWTGASGAGTSLSNILTSLPSGWSARNDFAYTGSSSLAQGTAWTDTLTANVTNVQYLLIGAGYPLDSQADYFKISALNVSSVATATPEPSTLGMFALSLAALGLGGQ